MNIINYGDIDTMKFPDLFAKRPPKKFTKEWAQSLSDEELKNEHDATFYDIGGYPPEKQKVPGTEYYTVETANIARPVLVDEINKRYHAKIDGTANSKQFRRRGNGTYLPNDED